jgi:Phage tail tube protein
MTIFAQGSQGAIVYALELEGGWGSIRGADFTKLTTTTAHGKKTGDSVTIGGTGSATDYAGTYTVLLVPTTTSLVIEHAYGAYTSGNTEATGGNITAAALWADDEYVPIQISSDSMKLTRNTFESGMIRSDRQIEYLSYGTKQAGDGVESEIVYRMWDDFFQAALFSLQWEKGTTVTVADMSADDPEVGDTITWEGSSTTGYNTTHIIIALNAAKTIATLDCPFIDDPATDGNLDIGGNNYAISAVAEASASNVLTNGVIKNPFTIERQLTDIGQYIAYPGMLLNNMSMNIAPDAQNKVTFSFMGKTESTGTSSQLSSGATEQSTASRGSSPIDSFTGALTEGGSAVSIITAVDFAMNNNVKTLFAIGDDEGVGIVAGRCQVTGNLTSYVQNLTLYNKFVNGTESSLRLKIEEGGSGSTNNNMYIIDMPRIKYTGGQIAISNEQELNNPMPFQALMHSTKEYTIRICRVDAV